MARSSRLAFTLVELLVVISIIGMLMALVLPAVQQTKEIARQINCTNNQGNLAKANLAYVDFARRFPGFTNGIQNNSMAVSWVVVLFPHLDRTELYENWTSTPAEFSKGSSLPCGTIVVWTRTPGKR